MQIYHTRLHTDISQTSKCRYITHVYMQIYHTRLHTDISHMSTCRYITSTCRYITHVYITQHLVSENKTLNNHISIDLIANSLKVDLRFSNTLFCPNLTFVSTSRLARASSIRPQRVQASHTLNVPSASILMYNKHTITYHDIIRRHLNV